MEKSVHGLREMPQPMPLPIACGELNEWVSTKEGLEHKVTKEKRSEHQVRFSAFAVAVPREAPIHSVSFFSAYSVSLW